MASAHPPTIAARLLAIERALAQQDMAIADMQAIIKGQGTVTLSILPPEVQAAIMQARITAAANDVRGRSTDLRHR